VWGPWKGSTACSGGAQCKADASSATCVGGRAKQCSAGPCCDTAQGVFRTVGHKCGAAAIDTKYACNGAVVLQTKGYGACTGSSEKCTADLLTWSDPTELLTCSAGTVCAVKAAGKEYECKAGVCQPSCAGKQCGTDGCGGDCGTCSAGEACSAGTCTAAADGGAADTAIIGSDAGSSGGLVPGAVSTGSSAGGCSASSGSHGGYPTTGWMLALAALGLLCWRRRAGSSMCPAGSASRR